MAKRRSKEMMMRRVTTHDIAGEAGVSRTTVSHVLNNHPGIRLSPKTRQRVLATARKIGYVPNSAAQMLVSGHSGSGIYLPPLTTVRSHAFEQGKLLGEAAIALMDGKETGSQQDVVQLELIIRASCGAKAS